MSTDNINNGTEKAYPDRSQKILPKVWSGRWSDGKTAAAHEVEMSLTETELTFTILTTRKTHNWTYNKIHSPNPVRPNSDHVMLTHENFPDERLFIDHPDFAKRILDFAPKITSSSHSWSLLKWPLGLAASLVCFWLLTYLNIISPAHYIANFLPDKARATLGNGVINAIKNNRKICHTPAGDKALQKLVTRLNEGTIFLNKPDIPFKIQVADLKIVNAFAAPGDQIIVSGKLIQEATSAEEVAGVIAHEMGHSIERHPETSIVRAIGMIAVMQMLTAGESGTFSELAFLLVQSGYSRTAESEADIQAADILGKTNIDSRPLAGFFERIIASKKFDPSKSIKTDIGNKNQKSDANNNSNTTSEKELTKQEKNESGSIINWISSHPPTLQRIDFFNQSRIKTNPPILTPGEWKALRTICGPESKKDKKVKTKTPAINADQ